MCSSTRPTAPASSRSPAAPTWPRGRCATTCPTPRPSCRRPTVTRRWRWRGATDGSDAPTIRQRDREEGSARALRIGGEALAPGALFECLQLLEEGHLPPRRTLDTGVEAAERGGHRRRDSPSAGLLGGMDRCGGVLDLEGEPKARPVGRTIGGRCPFDLVDGPHVGGAGDLEGRDAGVEDRDPVLTVGGAGELFGHAEQGDRKSVGEGKGR